MLELVNISRIYKQKNGPQVNALDNVSLTFNEKGMVFILGKSGSGKSTLLNVIGGLDKYTSGDLYIKGKSTRTFSQSEFDSYRNTMIGFIFQEYNVLEEFSVGQNIGIALELQGRKATNELINEYLDLLDMQGFAHRKPNTLSGGQKQRVAIARALVKSPEIIMADEPTGALDSVTGRQLFEALYKLSETKLVIVVTHDHEFAETYGDRIIEFKDGKVIRDVTKVKEDKKAQKTMFTPEGITVSKGYQLTAEDLVVINEYLARQTRNTHINVMNHDYKFEDTTSPVPYTHTDTLPLIKSKLPFKSALKMGANALKHKRFRLALSILLASTAFGMFGLTDTMGSFNNTKTAIATMIDKNIAYSSVTKFQHSPVEWDDEAYYSYQVRLDDNDITTLNAKDEDIHYFPTIDLELNGITYANNVSDTALFSNDPYHKNTSMNTLVNLKTADDLEKAGLSLLSGTLPDTVNKVAIPVHVYNAFKKYGYRINANGPKINISNYNDVVGLPFAEYFTISGVVETNLDIEQFKKLEDASEDEYDLYLLEFLFQRYLADSFHKALFVGESLFETLSNTERSYYDPTYSWMYFGFNYNDEEKEMSFENVLPIQDSTDNPSSIFFDASKTVADLTNNDIFLPASFLQFFYPSFVSVVNDAKEASKDAILASVLNNNSVEAFLKDYAYLFNLSPDEIGENEGWTPAEREMYQEIYADALLDSSLLYDENYYDPNNTGKNYFLPHLKTRVQAENYTPLEIDIQKYLGGELVVYPLNVSGFVFDYSNYEVANDGFYGYVTLYVGEKTATRLGLVLDGIYSRAIVHHGVNRQNITKLIEMNYEGENIREGFFYNVSNQVLMVVDQIGGFVGMLAEVFTVIGSIFAAFSSLLLVNFITLSVAFKKQEIGILRAIGARGFDVSSIFMNEAGIIAAINFILSLVATIVSAVILNNYFATEMGIEIVILVVGIRQILLMLVIAFGVAALSSFLPVYRLSRKKPIDAIRNM